MRPMQPVAEQTPDFQCHNTPANLDTDRTIVCENDHHIVENADPEKERLRRDLQEAVKARHEAEARTHKLEQLLGVLREKINVLSGKEKQQTTTSENSPEESLTSLSSSCGSPHLTMSGPVTCL